MKKEWAQMVIEDCTGSIMVNAFPKAYENMSHKLGPNAILNFMGNVRVDDESARIEINLQDVSNITDLIANRAKEFTVSLPADYTKNQLEKLKNYLEMTRGATAVYLEVPSKENPKKMHRIRTSKRIILHKSLLEFVENELGTSWSFK